MASRRRGVASLVDAGFIVLNDGNGAREVRIAKATADIGEALKGAQLVIIAAPAFAQADIARRMAGSVAISAGW